MKNLSLFTILISSLLFFQGCDDKKETTNELKVNKVYSLSTGSTLGSYYQLGQTIGKEMVNQGYSFKVVSSDGSEQNGRRVFGNITNFAFIQKDTHNLLSTIDGNYLNKVNVVTTLGEESILFIVNKTSNIKSEIDLKSNRVKIAITSKSSGANSSLDTMSKLNRDFANKEIVYKDFDKALNELNSKTIDAIMIVQSNRNTFNNDYIEKIISNNNLDIIDLNDNLLKNNKLNGKKVYNDCKFNFKSKSVNTICTETLLITNNYTDSNAISKIKEIIESTKNKY